MAKWLKAFDIKVVLAFAAVYIIWGTTYLAIKIGLAHIPPFMMAAFRYLVASILLLSFSYIKDRVFFSKEMYRQMLLGAFMLTLGQAVLFWAEKYLPSGLTAVFTSSLPIWYVLIDCSNWKLNFRSKLTIASIILGLVGILILFKGQLSSEADESPSMRLIASAVTIGACICWAAGSLYYKAHASGSLFNNVGWQLAGGTIAGFLISIVTGEWSGFSLAAVPAISWLMILYLAIAGSVIAFSASYYLLTVRPAPVVGTYAYVNPIVAVILGYFIAEETISTSQVAGIIIILVAAYLANTVKSGNA